jgi:hypothetical protein
MGQRSGVFLGAFLGGAALYLWQKSRRMAPSPLARDITRWEDEGGAVSTQTAWGEKAGDPIDASNGRALPATRSGGTANPGSTPDAWNFPRS